MRMPVRRITIAVLAVTLAACASAAPPPPPATTIPITSFQMVAGKWAGPIIGLASKGRDESDWIEVTIREDGTYDFGVARTIGMFAGKGQFAMKDGKLTSRSERGSAEYSLTERDGRQYLRVDGVGENERKVTADLTRAR